MKKFISLVLSVCFAVSVFSVPSFAAGSLIPSSGSMIDTLTGLTYGALSDSFLMSSIALNGLFNGAVGYYSGVNPSASARVELTNNSNNTTTSYYTSGARINNVYNQGTTNNYTAINTTNNNYYNLVTNNYSTYNSITYNAEYNTYNITNNEYNTYVTNNQTYLSYYIIDNNTHDTYYYEVYYELPDGRNSYNLKEEDVWGKYFIYDVINYSSVSEDDGTLALLHFDGNLNDDSFFQGANVMSDVPSSFVDGIWGSCLRLDNGSFKGIRFSDDSLSEPFTLEFKVRCSAPSSPYKIKDFFSGNSIFYTYRSGYESADYGVYYLDGSGSSNGLFWLPGSYNCNTWYTVALVFDGDSRSLYVDGYRSSYNNLTSFFWNGSLCNYVDFGYLFSPSGSIPANTYYPDGRIWLEYKNNLGTIYSNPDYRFGYGTVYLDEVRLSRGVLYTGNYTPAVQPFDTNKVLVVPSDAPSMTSTIAIQSDYKASGLRVGGVRPSRPDNGFVYVAVQDGLVLDVEQYIDNGWYSVNASYYANDRWNNFFGYNVDSTTTGTPPVSSGSDDSGSGSGSDGSGSESPSDILGGLSGLLGSLLLAVIGFFTSLFAWFSGFVALFGSLIPFVPGRILGILISSVTFILMIVILKFIRG